MRAGATTAQTVALLTVEDLTARTLISDRQPAMPLASSRGYLGFRQISDYGSAASVAPMTWRERLDGEMPTL